MTTEITLNLPDEVYRRAEHLAQMINRNVAEVLILAIALYLSPVSPQYVGSRKNLFDLRRTAVLHNLHVLAKIFTPTTEQSAT